MAPCFQKTKTEPKKNARNKNQSTASTAVHPEVLLGIIISLIVNCTLVWHLKDTKINHILLMVQKSGDHRLRLEVFFPLFSGVFIPSKRWLAAINSISDHFRDRSMRLGFTMSRIDWFY